MFERIREDLKTIFERDPAAHSKLEVALCYPGFHALIMHRWAYWCNLQGWPTFARWVSHAARFLTGVEIHPAAKIGRRVFIDHGMGVVIGETAEVGDDCTIYHGVTLGGTSLGRGEKRHPTIGNGVVIGAGAQILGGFKVGDNARIGSNAVVVKPVAANETIVGVPGRKVAEGAAQKKLNHEGFAAYAVTPGERDPYAAEIARLKRVVEEQQAVIEAMSKQVGFKPESVKLAAPAEVKAEGKPARKTRAVKTAAKAMAAAAKTAAKTAAKPAAKKTAAKAKATARKTAAKEAAPKKTAAKKETVKAEEKQA